MAEIQEDSASCCSMDDMEQENGNWQLLRRINKAKRIRGVKESEEKWNAVVRFEEPGVKSLDPLKLTKIIKNQVGEVKYARVLNDGNLLVGCNSEEQIERALKMQVVGKAVVVKVVKVGEQGSKGVIYGIPLAIEMKELVKNLKEKCGAVQSAKRLTKGIEKKETESVLVQFSTKELPAELFFGYMRYRVREFTHKPIRCYKCQKFGHVAKICKGNKRCAKCGGEHDYGECGEGVKPKCCNCGGGHSAAYWGCEVMRRETEIQSVKRKDRVHYAEAVKRVEQTKRVNEGNVRGEMATGNVWAQRQEQIKEKEKKEKKEWGEKRDLVIFIAGVINATAEVKSKTERIQIITKAAIQHLGMVDLKWEEIRECLVVHSSQEGGKT